MVDEDGRASAGWDDTEVEEDGRPGAGSLDDSEAKGADGLVLIKSSVVVPTFVKIGTTPKVEADPEAWGSLV